MIRRNAVTPFRLLLLARTYRNFLYFRGRCLFFSLCSLFVRINKRIEEFVSGFLAGGEEVARCWPQGDAVTVEE